MLTTLTIQNLLLATVLGGLIGLERERVIHLLKTQAKSAHHFAGIRTFILIAIWGLVASSLVEIWGAWTVIAGLAALTTLLVSAHVHSWLRLGEGSILTELDALIVFCIGVLVGQDMPSIALSLTVIVALVSALRHPLHHFAETVQDAEFLSTLKFAAIAILILPLLPDRNFDAEIFGFLGLGTGAHSFMILNPYKIWLMVVAISGISFAGYFLNKFFGNRGIEIGSFLGGLYSSTTTALTLAEKSKLKPKIIWSFLAALLFAYAAMVPRALLEIRAINSEFFTAAVQPIGLVFLSTLALGALFFHHAKKEAQFTHAVVAQNPFSVRSALLMAIFVVIVIVLAKIIIGYLDPRLLYVLAIVLGFAKMDPLVVTISAVAGIDAGMTESVSILALGMLANGLQKTLTLYFFGNRRLIMPWLICMLALGLIGWIAVVWLS